MRWRLNGADGAAGAKALRAPSTTWYLAEGNAGFFDTYVLLANPSATPTTATVDFLLDGGGVVRRHYSLGGNARYTIWTNQIPELATRSFATTVTSPRRSWSSARCTSAAPHGAFEGGHASAAVPTGARDWFLAEGSTGAWFETFVLISNPNASAVTATIRYLTPTGVARTEVRTLPATSRTTIPVDALPGLGSTDVSCSITRDRQHHRRAVDVLAGRAGAVVRRAQQRRHHDACAPAGAWRKARSAAPTARAPYVLLANPEPSRRPSR